MTAVERQPLRLCPPCTDLRCEDRGPDCDDNDVCQCPCSVMGGPEDVAAFARELRRVPMGWIR